MKRVPNGTEIDKIISDVEAGKALAIEHWRREDWRKRELSANSLKAEYGHARDAPPPHPVAASLMEVI
jgi:hypothetical protein